MRWRVEASARARWFALKVSCEEEKTKTKQTAHGELWAQGATVPPDPYSLD